MGYSVVITEAKAGKTPEKLDTFFATHAQV
jgi:hypothetical protein